MLYHIILLGILIGIPSIKCVDNVLEQICLQMVLPHVPHPPQVSPPPYNISISKTHISSGDKVDVNLKTFISTVKIDAFFVKAVSEDSIVGHFELDPLDPYVHSISCGENRGTGATDKKIYNNPPQNITLTWRAPVDFKGTIVFHALIGHEFNIYWNILKSEILIVE